jgi:hypothetical protein
MRPPAKLVSLVKKITPPIFVDVAQTCRRFLVGKNDHIPRVRAAAGQAASGTGSTSCIYVLSPDWDVPSGGVRRLYHLVDVLCANGLPAIILHEQAGFRCSWFASKTPVLGMSQVALNPNDYLVVPEIFATELANLAPGVPKVIYNQNAYYTFQGWPIEGWTGPNPYRHPDVVAMLAVSEDNLEYLRFAFPELQAYRIRHGIDSIFAPHWPKRRAIAYMPRKHAEDVVQVLNILRAHGALENWELVAIDGLAESEVARLLGECAIFLSFGYPEGFGLPPIEAMASGCAVIGYHGRGGKEYFDPAFSDPVETGDIVGFARAVENVLAQERTHPGTLERRGKQAMEFVRDHYSPVREAEEIVASWRNILSLKKTSAA